MSLDAFFKVPAHGPGSSPPAPPPACRGVTARRLRRDNSRASAQQAAPPFSSAPQMEPLTHPPQSSRAQTPRQSRTLSTAAQAARNLTATWSAGDRSEVRAALGERPAHRRGPFPWRGASGGRSPRTYRAQRGSTRGRAERNLRSRSTEPRVCPGQHLWQAPQEVRTRVLSSHKQTGISPTDFP